MNGIKNVGSVSLPSKMHVEGATNTLGVFQKNGRQFVRLSGEAGAESVQPQRSASRASAPTYEGIVTEIKEQIKTSATSRPLLDRIRDPRNHTTKTQVLQLVQLAAKESENGERLAASVALMELVDNPTTRPLLTSALASAMGGAPWVAEQNVKIGGALNMEALPFDAVEILAGLIASRRGRSDSPNDFGIRNDLSQNIATQIYAQLQKHAALSSPTAPFWRGLANLPPRQRCQLGKDFRGRLEGNAIPPQKDFVAAKLDASQREAWNIALEEQPIILPQRAGADRKIERFGDLKRLQDQTGVFFDSSAREREVKKVRTDISAAASAGGHRAKQVLARSLELGKSIEGDAEAVRSDLPVVRHRIHWDYAGGFGLNLPDSLRFLNNGLGDDRPKRSEVDAFAQERMLNVLEETFKSLPYESRNLSSCTTLADFHSGSSAKGKQAPTAERLYSALQALASYKPPEGAEITQEDCRALVQIGQRILESSPPSNYTSIIR